jgi:diguanylate cyclase (GGDEF)-like protein/PAS domain S-box-containing protein
MNAPLHDPATLALLIERMPEAIYVTDGGGEIVDANPAFLELVGLAERGELASLRVTDILAQPSHREAELDLLANGGVLRSYELKIRRRDGGVRTVVDSAFSTRDAETGRTLFLGMLVDITERKKLEEQLHEQAVRDPLTGCFNRRHLADVARLLEAESRPWGCLNFDLDFFKRLNDTLGHAEGDRALLAFSRFLLRHSRSGERIFRTGGDEFLIILENVGPDETRVASERIAGAGASEPVPRFTVGWAARESGEPLEKTAGRADQMLLERRGDQRRASGEYRRVVRP